MSHRFPTSVVALAGILLVSITTFVIFPFIRVSPTYASNQTSFNYVALGDSITEAGYDADGGYVSRYKNHLTTDLGVIVTAINKGIGGSTSTDLLNSLKTSGTFRSAVANANQVSVMIGLNDLIQAGVLYVNNNCGGTDNQDCLRNEITVFQSNIVSIFNEIKLINTKPSLNVILSEIYYPSSGNMSTDPNTPIFNPYLTQMNDAISSLGQANNLGVAEVNIAFNGVSGNEDPFIKGYLLEGLHPNSLGFDVIANEFRKLNSFILNKDTDADGFINSKEKYLGTDIIAGCPTSTSHAAYPPDFDNNGRVLVNDISAVVKAYYKDITYPDWVSTYKKYDLDMNGKITINDVNAVVSLYSKSFC